MSGEPYRVDSPRAVGLMLVQRRRDLKLSQSEVARRAGVTSSTLCHMEKGVSNPSLGSLALVLKVLDMSLWAFPMKPPATQ